MKRLSFGAPIGTTPEAFRNWVIQSLKKIEYASNEDIETIFQAYTVVGDLAPTRTLDLKTATFPDLLAVIATLITDVQKGGPNRTE